MTFLRSSAGWFVIGGLLASCSSSPGLPEDDAARSDAGVDTGTTVDASNDGDASDDGDAGTSYCVDHCLDGCDPSVCIDAIPVAIGATLTLQDSATGAVGDCAPSGSGTGGPNLYYALTVPAGAHVDLRVIPDDETHDGLVRVLADCAATESESSARGGGSTMGVAELCFANDAGEARNVIVAVGRYSGEADHLPLAYTLEIAEHDPETGCL